MGSVRCALPSRGAFDKEPLPPFTLELHARFASSNSSANSWRTRVFAHSAQAGIPAGVTVRAPPQLARLLPLRGVLPVPKAGSGAGWAKTVLVSETLDAQTMAAAEAGASVLLLNSGAVPLNGSRLSGP